MILCFVPFILQLNAVIYGNLLKKTRYGGVTVDLELGGKQGMVVCVIWIILPGITLSDDVISCKIQEQSRSSWIVIQIANHPVQQGFSKQFLNDQVISDPKASTAFRSALLNRQFRLRKKFQVVGIWIHLGGIILTDFADGGPFWGIVFLFRIVDSGIFILDVCDALLFLRVNLAFDIWNRHSEVIVHGFTPQYLSSNTYSNIVPAQSASVNGNP